MRPLVPSDLLSPEDYARLRPSLRPLLLARKAARRVVWGDLGLSFLFEDRWTLLYQVQEVLRAEGAVDEEAVDEELAAVNSIFAAPQSLACTLLIELPEAARRARELPRLAAAAGAVSLRFADGSLARGRLRGPTTERAAVFFLLFPRGEAEPVALRVGAGVGCERPLPPSCRRALARPQASSRHGGSLRDLLAVAAA